MLAVFVVGLFKDNCSFFKQGFSGTAPSAEPYPEPRGLGSERPGLFPGNCWLGSDPLLVSRWPPSLPPLLDSGIGVPRDALSVHAPLGVPLSLRAGEDPHPPPSLAPSPPSLPDTPDSSTASGPPDGHVSIVKRENGVTAHTSRSLVCAQTHVPRPAARPVKPRSPWGSLPLTPRPTRTSNAASDLLDLTFKVDPFFILPPLFPSVLPGGSR